MYKILVIDDEETIRNLLKKAFQKKGYQVEIAENGKVGVEIFQKKPADLVITDIIMPEKEGLETIMELRSISSRVKIIAISGGLKYGPELNLSAAKILGADYTTHKPFDLKQLFATVDELLHGLESK